ncbi:MAG: hypothetical protein V8T40_05630 [Phocaeicola vulgatus]
MVTYCRQGTSVGILPLWVWWSQCGTLTAITYRFGAFIDIFTPEHTDNEDDEVTGKFYISR